MGIEREQWWAAVSNWKLRFDKVSNSVAILHWHTWILIDTVRPYAVPAGRLCSPCASGTFSTNEGATATGTEGGAQGTDWIRGTHFLPHATCSSYRFPHRTLHVPMIFCCHSTMIFCCHSNDLVGLQLQAAVAVKVYLSTHFSILGSKVRVLL